jgi:hypothetical protein
MENIEGNQSLTKKTQKEEEKRPKMKSYRRYDTRMNFEDSRVVKAFFKSQFEKIQTRPKD